MRRDKRIAVKRGVKYSGRKNKMIAKNIPPPKKSTPYNEE